MEGQEEQPGVPLPRSSSLTDSAIEGSITLEAATTADGKPLSRAEDDALTLLLALFKICVGGMEASLQALHLKFQHSNSASISAARSI